MRSAGSYGTDFYRRFFEQVHRHRLQSGRAGPNAPSSPEDASPGASARIPADVESILDVGCGTAEFLNRFSGYKRVGVDLCHDALLCVTGHRAVASADVLPFRSRTFDLVTCFELLEHLPQPRLPLAVVELQRVTRKYIIISVPNQELLKHLTVMCPECYCRFNPSWHVRSFDRLSLELLFNEFHMLECTECGPRLRSHRSALVSFYRHFAPRLMEFPAVCPQCGYCPPRTYPDARSSRLPPRPANWRKRAMQLATGVAMSLVTFEERPYWLLASYERRHGS